MFKNVQKCSKMFKNVKNVQKCQNVKIAKMRQLFIHKKSKNAKMKKDKSTKKNLWRQLFIVQKSKIV